VTDATKDSGFVDAARVYRTLRGAFDAPGLTTAARERFPTDASQAFDGAAFDLLYDDDFVRVPPNLADEIAALRDQFHEAERAQDDLQGVQSRLKTLELQLRNAKHDSERGLLKNKIKRLEQASRVERLEQQVAQLRLRRHQLEGVTQRVDLTRRTLLEQIEGDPHLRGARWYGDRPVVVTHHGDFLAEYLDELNPTHFRGRTLAEIIEIGPALA
jgi:hypothetical protein